MIYIPILDLALIFLDPGFTPSKMSQSLEDRLAKQEGYPSRGSGRQNRDLAHRVRYKISGLAGIYTYFDTALNFQLLQLA